MTSTSINLGDADAWDDSELVDSWEAVAQEYKKYHSIHMLQKTQNLKLSEILTQEEIATLKSHAINVNRSAKLSGGDNVPADEYAEEMDSLEYAQTRIQDSKEQEPEEVQATPKDKDLTEGFNMEMPTHQSDGNPIPDHLMSSVKDSSLKNLMMSWYWAGYYTGLHEGQKKSAD